MDYKYKYLKYKQKYLDLQNQFGSSKSHIENSITNFDLTDNKNIILVKENSKIIDLKDEKKDIIKKFTDDTHILKAINDCGYLIASNYDANIYRIIQKDYTLYLDTKLIKLCRGHIVNIDKNNNIINELELIYDIKTRKVTNNIFNGNLTDMSESMIKIFNCVMDKLNNQNYFNN